MNVSTRMSFVITTGLLLLVLSAGAAEAQAGRCRPCEIAQERCSVNCLGREGNAVGACLNRCDNAAAQCTCDEPATLSSEDYVERFGGVKVVTAFSGACHSTTPCGSEYSSCASWSSYSNCGDPFCGVALGCGECDEWGHCEAGGPAMKQFRERFRVCFNQQGQPCTEYQRTAVTQGCGC